MDTWANGTRATGLSLFFHLNTAGTGPGFDIAVIWPQWPLRMRSVSAVAPGTETEEGEVGAEIGKTTTKRKHFLQAIKQVQNDAKKLLKRQNKQASLKLAPDQLQKLLVVDDAEANNRSTSHAAFDEFDILEKGARLSLEEFDDIDSIKFGDTNGKVNDVWNRGEEEKYFSFKANRFAQAKSLVMKESEEMYALRQAVADLGMYINNLQSQLKKS